MMMPNLEDKYLAAFNKQNMKYNFVSIKSNININGRNIASVC